MQGRRSETDLHGCLKDAGTADAIDIADAAAQGAGDFAKALDVDEAVGRPKAGVLVMLKASNRASRTDSW